MAYLSNTETSSSSTDEKGKVALHHYPTFKVFLDRGNTGLVGDTTVGQLWPRGSRITSV